MHCILLLDWPILVFEPKEVIVDFFRTAEKFLAECLLLDLLAQLPSLKLWYISIFIILVHDFSQEFLLGLLRLQNFWSYLIKHLVSLVVDGCRLRVIEISRDGEVVSVEDFRFLKDLRV